jgi:hypothetical protein
MFKKTLIAAAALSTLLLGASAANAGYGISVGYGHGGYGHGYGHGHYSLQFTDYNSGCYVTTRPVTIRVWDDYSDGYFFKTIYRQVRVCD